MENGGPTCLGCVGVADLEFLSAGDALLMRRAKAKSARHAVVVRFSERLRRYERRACWFEPQAWNTPAQAPMRAVNSRS